MGEFDKAIADYGEAVKLCPFEAFQRDQRGHAWAAKGDFDKAIEDFTEAIRIDRGYPDAYYDRGEAWREKKEFDKAIADYKEAIRIDPAHGLAPLGLELARSERELKELVKTRSELEKAIAENGKELEKAVAAIDGNDLTGKRVVQKTSQLVSTPSRPGRPAIPTLPPTPSPFDSVDLPGRRDDAKAQPLREPPRSPFDLFDLPDRRDDAKAQPSRGPGPGGDKNDTKVATASSVPIFYLVAAQVGDRLLLQTETGATFGWVKSESVIPADEAFKFFTKQILTNPKDAFSFAMLGMLYHDNNELDAAVGGYDRAIQIDPKNASYFTARAAAWQKKKDYVKTIADYSEAIRINPKHAWAFNNLAWLLATCPDPKIRDGKKAIELANQACELSEWKEAYHVDTLAAAHAEAGDFDAAVKWETKALALYAPSKDREGGQARLKLYQAKKPYREVDQ